MIAQRDLFAPSGEERLELPDEPPSRYSLRRQVLARIDTHADLYEVAERAGLAHSLQLTAWLRGEEELTQEQIGALHLIARRG
mgnify:CR=1 FL=1